MEAYSSLVDKVLNNPILKKAVEDKTETHDTINLIRPSWEQHLDNYALFQDIRQNAKDKFQKPAAYGSTTLQFMRRTEYPLRVLLVGNCMINRQPGDDKQANVEDAKQGNVKDTKKYKSDEFAVLMLDSVVLKKIGDAMTSDMDSSYEFGNYLKFSMKPCQALLCSNCMSSRHYFESKGYPISKENQPCIVKTKWFDGEKITNRFASTLKESLPGCFNAIMLVEIHTRLYFTKLDKDGITKKNIVKIRGSLLDMIGFQASKLSNVESVFLGDLSNMVPILSENELAEVYPMEAFEKQQLEMCPPIPEGCGECLTVETRLEPDVHSEKKRSLDEVSSEDEEPILQAIPKGRGAKKEMGERNANKKQKYSDVNFLVSESQLQL